MLKIQKIRNHFIHSSRSGSDPITISDAETCVTGYWGTPMRRPNYPGSPAERKLPIEPPAKNENSKKKRFFSKKIRKNMVIRSKIDRHYTKEPTPGSEINFIFPASESDCRRQKTTSSANKFMVTTTTTKNHIVPSPVFQKTRPPTLRRTQKPKSIDNHGGKVKK